MLPAARTTLLAALDAGWADPRRLYAEGRAARALLDQAREVLAHGLGVRPAEVSFLPSGPSALRTGLEGLRYAGRRRGARMVATAVEHSAILTTGRYHAAAAQDPSLFAEVPVDPLGRVDLSALQQAVLGPGTALAAAEAWQQTQANHVDQSASSFALVRRLRAAVGDLRDVDVVGDPDDRLPHVLTFSLLYVDGEALVIELDRRGFAVGSGSACTSSTLEPSHVLAAMGVLTHGNETADI